MTIVRICIILLVCSCVPQALAQTRSLTTLSGTVTDSVGSLISKVAISLKARDGQVTNIESGLNGEYKATLEPGIYSITFVKFPFKKFEIPEFQVQKASGMHLDVSLICEGCILIDEDLTGLTISRKERRRYLFQRQTRIWSRYGFGS